MRFKDEKLTDEHPSPFFQINNTALKATIPFEKGYGVSYHRD